MEIHEMAKRIRKKRKINKIEARLEDQDIGRSQKPRKTKVCQFSLFTFLIRLITCNARGQIIKILFFFSILLKCGWTLNKRFFVYKTGKIACLSYDHTIQFQTKE